MAGTNFTQARIKNTGTAGDSLFQIAIDLKGKIELLKEMFSMAMGKAANLSSHMSGTEVLGNASFLIALLDASNMYLAEVDLVCERVYDQSTAMKNLRERKAA